MRNARRLQIGLLTLPVALAATLLLLNLWSCSSSDAQTAQNRLVETFLTDPGSFRIVTDNTPDTAPVVTVDGDTTTYEIRSSGTLSFFNMVGGAVITRTLDPTDVVIERPVAGLITFIREQ